MAIKALMLRKKLEIANAKMAELRELDADFQTREAELEQAIEEAATEEEQQTVEETVEAFSGEKEAHEGVKAKLEDEIRDLEAQLAEEEERSKKIAEPPVEKKIIEERKVCEPAMERVQFFGMNANERSAFFASEEVKSFLSRVREMKAQNRAVTGANLLIPENVLELIRVETARQSKLVPFVRMKRVKGTARQNIEGSIPEAVWTEMCANLNELNIAFNAIELDGYKVGGYVVICNSTLEDTDINLVTEIITVLGGAIAKALDKAILFGEGTKMPLGIATRLAQTTQPSDWGSNAPAWTDLHTTNIKKLNIGSESGVNFFAELMNALGIAKPVYSSDGLFWVMNRKTHIAIKAKALAFNAAAALVSGVEGTLPVIGGSIIELEDANIADGDIIGGYGAHYLLAEREGGVFDYSDKPLFLQDVTAFKGTARYDGAPVMGEAFVAVNINNVNVTTSADFAIDYAENGLHELTVQAAAGTASGDTVLTVTDTVKASGATLKYKIGANITRVREGMKAGSGWADLTSGSTQITAPAGTNIVVVELDAKGAVVSAGQAVSVPNT